MEVAVKEGKYIYCIIETEGPKSFGPLGIGERGDEVYTICFNDIAAVVSNSPIKKYPVSRENLVPHERTIEEVMKNHTVLPVRFCTIAEDENKVKKILENEYDRFKDLINEIRGKKELSLKAVFKEEIIYKDIAENYDEIKRLKSIIASKPSEQTHYERVEIGKMVEIALENEREKYKKEMLESLLPLTEDVRINGTYGERMLLNAAFLVNEEKETEFDQSISELAEKYGEKVKFKYVGTLPPFNFVNLLIRTEEY